MSYSDSLEKTRLKLGFIALSDCAPLIVAREKGFFKANGLDVVLCKEASWASLRDKISYGLLDAAHMLAPLPLAATLGLNGKQIAMETPLVLSQDGTAITLAKHLLQKLQHDPTDNNDGLTDTSLHDSSDETLGRFFKQMLNALEYRPTIATVYPYSNHHYLLRFWLEKHGITPGRDINLIATPPTQMLDQLTAGAIDGYCVGEPWNSLAVIKDVGGILKTGNQIWGAHMEKVLSVTQAWASQHPQTYQALTQAIYEACVWVENPVNHPEALKLLALPPYLDRAISPLQAFAPVGPIQQRFAGENVNCPNQQHGFFLLQQMRRYQQLAIDDQDACTLCQQVFRRDLYQRWLK